MKEKKTRPHPKQEYESPQIIKYLSIKDITRDTTSITGDSTAMIDCPNHDDCGSYTLT